jgi:hypothetical protein
MVGSGDYSVFFSSYEIFIVIKFCKDGDFLLWLPEVFVQQMQQCPVAAKAATVIVAGRLN